MFRYWASVIGIGATLLGAFLLFRGFQATSTDLKMVSAKDGSPIAMCAYGTAFLTWASVPTDKSGTPGCPTSMGTVRSVAGVVYENGGLIPWGWIVTMFGAVAQLVGLGLPPNRTLNEPAGSEVK